MKVRNFTATDIDPVRALVARQPSLVLYPPYAYWLLATGFSDCSFVLEGETGIVGYIGALPVEAGRAMFIWQFVVGAEGRETVRGDALVNRVIDAALARGCGQLRATIGLGNRKSYNAMSRILARRGLAVRHQGTGRLNDFGVTDAVVFDIYQSDLSVLAVPATDIGVAA